MSNFDEINKYFGQLEDKLSEDSFQYPLNSAGNYVRNIIEESFENQSDPITKQRWKPLKKSTKMKKLKKGKSDKILRQDGDLEDNWEIAQGKNEVKIFNNSKDKDSFAYGIVHQFGSNKKNIPQRRFLPLDADGELDKEIEDEVIGIFDKFLQKAIK